MSEFLFSYFAAGFEKAFAEFTKKQEQRDMALLEKLQQLQANDEVTQAAIAEHEQVIKGIADAIAKSDVEKDAQIKDLLAQLASQKVTLDQAEAIVDEITAKRASEVEAVTNVFTPEVPATETPAPEPTV